MKVSEWSLHQTLVCLSGARPRIRCWVGVRREGLGLYTKLPAARSD